MRYPQTDIVDRKYGDTWKARNMTSLQYQEYLKSDEWKLIKQKAGRRKKFKKCFICGSTERIELHHKTYKWMHSAHELRAIVALCRIHHEKVHEYARKENISVRLATNRIYKFHRMAEIIKSK